VMPDISARMEDVIRVICAFSNLASDSSNLEQPFFLYFA
jgi:hypothetical protein